MISDTTSDRRTAGSRRATATLVIAGLVLAATLSACTSTNPPATQVRAGGSSAIPSSAFHDTTGINSSSVTVGNVSTLYAGLFKGALVGTQAYAAYVNSTGGIGGRRLIVDPYDDNFQGAPNKQATDQVVQKDFAAVGSFSLEDHYGETVLAANPGVPNVTLSLDQTASDLPNSFSPDPASIGWPTGPLLYFKGKFPTEVQHAGALIADQPSAITKWSGEKAAMESLGYKVI